MKKQLAVAFLSLLIILSCILAACTSDTAPPSTMQPNNTDNSQAPGTDYQAKINELESKISELQKNQTLTDAEYQKELKLLTDELEALKAKAEAESKPPQDTQKDHETQEPTSSQFLYTVSDGKATITGYTGKEAHLVIPAAIEGYPVYAIADNAFSSNTIKTITLPSALCRIGWFAFYECSKLESVTVPSSVTSIGYSAFPDSSHPFTLYCHNDSFAHSYAKSYGLNYAVI